MTTTKPTLKRGDVVLVLFPHSDLKTAKPRPALVVQTDNLESGLSQVVVAMITSRVFRANRQSPKPRIDRVGFTRWERIWLAHQLSSDDR